MEEEVLVTVLLAQFLDRVYPVLFLTAVVVGKELVVDLVEVATEKSMLVAELLVRVIMVLTGILEVVAEVGAGSNANNQIGGAGVTSSITGGAAARAGGGGGAPNGYGQAGGGNCAPDNQSNGESGSANTGGGGGGGGSVVNRPGGNGGSGLVVIRYLTTDASTFNITGGSKSTSGSYTVHIFTGSGSLVVL